MSHASQNGIWLAPLHYRALQRVHSSGTLRFGCKQSNQILDLSQCAMRDVKWWMSQEPKKTNAQHLRYPPFDLVIHTDASLLGWGASADNTAIGGHWSPEKSRLHINVQELKAAYLAIQAFTRNRSSVPGHIYLHIDNTTAVAYINRTGETHSPSLSAVVLELWSYVLEKGSWVTATHIPGILNSKADTASRHFNPRVEWTLDSSVFQKIVDRFYLPDVDLFASRLSHQVKKYVSRFPDPGAIAVDACLSPRLEQWELSNTPPCKPSPSGSGEDPGGQSDSIDDSTQLAQPTLVPTVRTDVGRLPSPAANVEVTVIPSLRLRSPPSPVGTP